MQEKENGWLAGWLYSNTAVNSIRLVDIETPALKTFLHTSAEPAKFSKKDLERRLEFGSL